jgi:hypothetical protein
MAYRFKKDMQNLITPTMQVGVVETGNWDKITRFSKWLSSPGIHSGIRRDLAKSQRDHLEQYKWVLISALESSGDYIGRPFQEHSESYAESGRTGPSVGIRSGQYQDALYMAQVQSKGYVVSLNLPGESLKLKSPLPSGKILRKAFTMSKYAVAFEKGTSRQPARPLWAGSWEYLGGTRGLVRKMNGAVSRRLSEMGIQFSAL